MLITDITAPLEADVTANAALLQAFARDKFPAADVNKGSVLYDLLIRPAAILGSLLNSNAATIHDLQTLTGIESNPLADYYGDVDAVLSNYLIARKDGTAASGTALLILSSDAVVAVPEGTELVFNARTFFTTAPVVGTTGSLIGPNDVTMVDNGDGTFSLPVPVEAETYGAAYNLPAGARADSASIPNFEYAKTNGDITNGLDRETVTSALERLRNGLSTKTWCSRLSIASKLDQLLPGIRVGVIGYGDTGMTRDISPTLGMSVGGKCDIYVSPEDAIETVTADVNAVLTAMQTWKIEIPAAQFAGVHTVMLKRLDGTTIPNVTIERRVVDPEFHTIRTIEEAAGSRFVEATLTAVDSQTDPRLALGTIRAMNLELVRTPHITTLQDTADYPAERGVRTDDLVKAANVVRVSIEATVVIPSGSTFDVTSARVAVAQSVNALGLTNELGASQLISALHAYLPAGGSVRMPIELVGTVENLQTFESEVVRASNHLKMSKVGANTTRMFAQPSTVNISIVSA